MPSIVGNVKINSVGSAGVLIFGDTLFLSPTSSSKTFAGSGSFVTGDFPITNTAVNNTMVNDPDVVDNNATKVGP